MDAHVSPQRLVELSVGAAPPVVVDVRREPTFLAADALVAGALRRLPDDAPGWADEFPAGTPIVVYCMRGHEVSQAAAATLRARGLDAAYLEGGFEAWQAAGGALMRKPAGSPTRWITRERPKVDRIACPWLVRRFIDARAEFLYVPTTQVRTQAQAQHAIPYDIPDVEYSHDGERCSFDAFLARHHLRDPALEQLALIVRGADTARPDLAPQAAGLVALSLGLSRLFADDHEMLGHGMVAYDALYLWCRDGQEEQHTWNPEAYR